MSSFLSCLYLLLFHSFVFGSESFFSFLFYSPGRFFETSCSAAHLNCCRPIVWMPLAVEKKLGISRALRAAFLLLSRLFLLFFLSAFFFIFFFVIFFISFFVFVFGIICYSDPFWWISQTLDTWQPFTAAKWSPNPIRRAHENDYRFQKRCIQQSGIVSLLKWRADRRPPAPSLP